MCIRDSCNRLDRNTSGIVIAGVSLYGLQHMSALLRERGLDKYYWCLVCGEVKESALIRGYLKKDEASNKVEADRFEQRAFAVLNVLSHRVQVGRQREAFFVFLVIQNIV